MYNIPDLFKEFLKRSDRTIDAKIVINNIEYTSAEVVEFNIEDSISFGDSLEIGTAISSKFTCTIRTADNIGKNAKIKPYFRLGLSLEWMNANMEWMNANFTWAEGYTEWMPLGEFYIDERKFNDGTWKFTCYDKLIIGNQAYETTIIFPTTMDEVLNDVCAQLEIERDSSVQINPAYIVPFNYDYTISEVIRYIAISHGACVKITKNGKLGFVKFSKNDVPVDSVTPADYSTITHAGELKTITRIVVKYNEDGEYLEVGSGDETKTLNLYNPFITESMLNNIFTELNGYSYSAYDVQWRCYPYLETGDRINIGYLETPAPVWAEVPIPWDDAKFNWESTGEFSTVILNSKIVFKGGLSGKLSAQAAAEQQAEFKGTLTRKVETLSKTTIKEDKPYYGVTVGRANGLNIKKSDGSSEVILNSDQLTFKAGGQDRIYFDPISGKYKFNGTLEATDGVFGGTVFAESIDTSHAKIKTAQIEDLIVGGNVTMGPNATISWNQVTNANALSVEAWRNSGYGTHIDASGVYTGTIWANQINGKVANLSESVNIGDVNSYESKSINFYNMGSQYTRITAYSGGGLELMADSAIGINASDSVNLSGGFGNINLNSSGTEIWGGQFKINSDVVKFADGSWVHFEDAFIVSGLITDTGGAHNHGIPNGTRLLTEDGGVVTFVQSGSHYHFVSNSE